jgi:hypothetical protein
MSMEKERKFSKSAVSTSLLTTIPHMSQKENPGPNSPHSEASTAELERQLAARKAAKDEKARAAAREQEAADEAVRDLKAKLDAALRKAGQLEASSKVGEGSGAFKTPTKTPTKAVGPTPPSAKKKVPYVSVPPVPAGAASVSPKRRKAAVPEAEEEVDETPRLKGKGKGVDPAERGEPDKSGKKVRLLFLFLFDGFG